MKRWTAILLTLLLAAFALNAGAADYTLDEKLIKQVKDGSGLKLTVTTEKTGGSFSSLSPEVNAVLEALLPGAELSLNYLRGVGTIKGMRDLELVLSKGGETLAQMRSLQDTQFESLSSTLFDGVAYADVQDGGALMAMLINQDPTWPPLEGVLLKLYTAESTWQTNAAKKMEAYQLKLSLWLQGYTKTETIRDANNAMLTRIMVSVPAAQLKSQIKQLMVDMYNDAELLSLLARELNGRESAAYLQPGMLDGFFSSLDLLPIEGTVTSERLMDNQGQLVENKISLPMGGARGIRQINYAYTVQEAGEQTELAIIYQPQNAANELGAVLLLNFIGGPLPDAPDSLSFTGTLTMQPEANADAFTVDKTEAAKPETSYAFRLYYSAEPEVIDSTQGSSSRDFETTLLITPQWEGAPAAQNFRVKMHLESRQSSRAATYFTGSLVWQDMGSQAEITAAIKGNTAPPWVIPAVDTAGATRVDSLSVAQFTGLTQQLQSTIKTAYTQLLLRLGGPVNQP